MILSLNLKDFNFSVDRDFSNRKNVVSKYSGIKILKLIRIIND